MGNLLTSQVEACLSTFTFPLLLALFLFSVVLQPSNTLEILFICYVYYLLSASPHGKARQGTWPISFTVVPQEPGSTCNTQGARNKHLLTICQMNLLLNFTFFFLTGSSLIKWKSPSPHADIFYLPLGIHSATSNPPYAWVDWPPWTESQGSLALWFLTGFSCSQLGSANGRHHQEDQEVRGE